MLTEGPIDAIMMHQAGYPMTVATSGTAVTEEHLQKLQRLSNRLLIVLDGDAAGNRAALRVIELAFTLGMDCKVAVLPEGSDPADMICAAAAPFRQVIREALSVAAFLMHFVGVHYGSEGEDRIRGVREVVFPVIASCRDPMVREYVIKEVSDFCGLSSAVITEQVGQFSAAAVPRSTGTRFVRKRAVVSDDGQGSERRMRDWYRIAALASGFLSKHDTPCRESSAQLFRYVQEFRALPEVDETVAVMRYEERFPEKKEQLQGAQDELEGVLRRLCSEIKKQQELEKLKTAELGS